MSGDSYLVTYWDGDSPHDQSVYAVDVPYQNDGSPQEVIALTVGHDEFLVRNLVPDGDVANPSYSAGSVVARSALPAGVYLVPGTIGE